MDMKPCAAWSDDCQGKKDYDGRLLDISTRYWPGSAEGGSLTFDMDTKKFSTKPYGEKPSAHSSILLRVNLPNRNGFGDYYVWREEKFEGETEAHVRAMVEAWVEKQMADVVELLGGQSAFRAG